MRTGKTVIFIAVLDSERKFPAVLFCRSIDLAYQTVRAVKKFLPWAKVGIVGDGHVDIQMITVVTIQSAFAAWNKPCEESGLVEEKEIAANSKAAVQQLVQSARAVFYDEVHHSQSRTSKFILDKCKQAEMKIGLSATPFEGEPEDLLVEEVAGPIIHSVSYSELIRQGYLLRPTIYMYKLPPVDVADDARYNSVYKTAVTDNEFLAGLIKKAVDKLRAQNKTTVVQTEYINHTKQLGKVLDAVTLTGSDKSGYRQEVMDGLRSRKISCVVSTLFEEGIDIPSLDYTVNAAGGLSNIGTLQRMRSLTATDGKTRCGIIDFYHQCKYLERHSRVRRRLYKSESEFVVIDRDVSHKTLEEIV